MQGLRARAGLRFTQRHDLNLRGRVRTGRIVSTAKGPVEGIVHEEARHGDGEVRPRRGSRSSCRGFGRRAFTCDHQPPRRFRFVSPSRQFELCRGGRLRRRHELRVSFRRRRIRRVFVFTYSSQEKTNVSTKDCICAVRLALERGPHRLHAQDDDGGHEVHDAVASSGARRPERVRRAVDVRGGSQDERPR